MVELAKACSAKASITVMSPIAIVQLITNELGESRSGTVLHMESTFPQGCRIRPYRLGNHFIVSRELKLYAQIVVVVGRLSTPF